MSKLAIAVLFASVVFGQDINRVFHLTNATTVASLQEIATTLRTVAQIQQLSIDPTLATMTVKGTADQIALSEWLVPKLDVVSNSNSGPQNYPVMRGANDVVVVYALTHTTTNVGIQEIITTLRTVANIQKIYMVTTPRILTLRGTASQIALAEFLLSELDQSAQKRQSALVHEFKAPTDADDVALVYGLANAESARSIQEIITNLRAVLDIQKVFQVSAPRVLAVRGRPSQIQMAEWLISELDRQTANAGANEARVPGGNDDVVHVFYLTHVTSEEGLKSLLTTMHTTAHIMRAYVLSAPAALVARGTADEIGMAGRMIELSDRHAP